MIDLRTSLYYHLQSNHYPPVHVIFIDAAIEAINFVNDGYPNNEIALPNGISKAAWEIVEELHLEFYLDNDEDDDTGYCDVCNELHQNASSLDHCPDCGNCFDHCTCFVCDYCGGRD